MKKQLIALALIFLLAMAVVACGYSSDSTGHVEPAPTSTTAEETTTEHPAETSLEAESETTQTTSSTAQATAVAAAKTASTAAAQTTTRTTTTTRQTTSTARSTTTTRTTTTTRAITTSITKRTATTNGAFDINDYIAYGIEYGESIGYRYIPGANESWDNPISAYPAIPDAYIKEAIRGQFDFYKKTEPDVTAFNIWAEKQPDGTYDIYIARG